MPLLMLLLARAWAAVPEDLDGLVALALARDPGALALALDAEAARARSRGALLPMDPELVAGVDALGAPEDAADPTVGALGLTQRFQGFGERRALAARRSLDAERALAEREVLAADLRLQLWQSAARIRALEEELMLLDEQLRTVDAAREIASARGETASELSILVATTGATATPVSGGSGVVSALLSLDVEIAVVRAERAALSADLDGELAVLGVFVGDEVSLAVRGDPARFLGGPLGGPPELAVADVDRQIAAADLRLARRSRNPDFLVSASERLLPDGRPAGTDVAVGIAIPLWGSRAREVEAAVAAGNASDARRDVVARDLAVATALAQASFTAAQARAEALARILVPRARARWETTLARFGAGTTTSDDLVGAWGTWLSVGRDAVQARLDVELRAAELARVEDR